MKKHYLGLIIFIILCFTGLYANINDPFIDITQKQQGLIMHSRIFVNGFNASPNDLLVTFVGDEVRGKNDLIILTGTPYVGVSAGSLIQTMQTAETLHFFLWRRSEQVLLTTTTTFQTDMYTPSIGTTTTPININFTMSSLTISGQVITVGGTGIEGITISSPLEQETLPYKHFFTPARVTNSLGYYAIPGIPVGTTIHIVPLSYFHDFSPPIYEIPNMQISVTRNFTATSIPVNISGTITHSGQPLDGVDIIVGAETKATTNAIGYYIFQVEYGSSLAFFPQKDGYVFTPPIVANHIVFEHETHNFTASLQPFNIGGTITLNGAPLQGIEVYSGQTLLATTNASGVYTFTAEIGSQFVLTPINEWYTFTPPNRPLTVSGTSMDNNFIATEIPSYTFSFLVQSSGSPVADVNIVYQVGAGTPEFETTNLLGYTEITLYETTLPITFTPIKAGHTFDPVIISIPFLNDTTTPLHYDIEATIGTFSVSGVVLSEGVGLAGASIAVTGDITTTLTTGASGIFSLSNVPYNSSLTLTPSLAHYTFLPTQVDISNIIDNVSNIEFTANRTKHNVTVSTIDYDDDPIPDIRINYISLTTCGHSGNGLTNNQGFYVFSACQGENYRVFLSDYGNHLFDIKEQNTGVVDAPIDLSFLSRPPTPIPVVIEVLDAGQPLTDVKITYLMDNGDTDFALTGPDGKVIFNLFETDQDITFTPFKEGYRFEPPFRKIEGLNSDTILPLPPFAAFPQTFTISGTVRFEDGVGLGNVIINTNGFGSTTTKIEEDVRGQYTISNVPWGSNVTLTPTRSGFSFTPLSVQILNITEDQDDIDFEAVGIPLFVTVRTIRFNTVPISGILVSYVSTPSGHTGLPMTTGLNGEAIFEAHYGENYEISISNTGTDFFEETVQFSGEITQDIEIIFQTRPRNQITLYFSVQMQNTLAPLAGVNIIYQVNNGPSGEMITLPNGNASISLYETNENILFTPLRAGYTFTPPQIILPGLYIYTPINYSFLATIQSYDISGAVVFDNIGLPGVTVTALQTITNVTLDTAITNVNGIYNFTNLPHGVSFNLIPSLGGYSFSPSSYLVQNLSSHLTIPDFIATDAILTITVQIVDYNVPPLPVQGVQINYSSHESSHSGSGFTDNESKFEFLANYLESYEISISDPLNHFFTEYSLDTGLIENPDTYFFYTREQLVFTLSGTVTDDDDAPMVNMPIQLIYPSATVDLLTDTDGFYTHTILERESFQIVPVNPIYNFIPPTISITNVEQNYPNQDFIASLKTYPITGGVTKNSQPLAGVQIFNNSVLMGQTDTQGQFSFEVNHGALLHITPFFEGHIFDPPEYVINSVVEPVDFISFEAFIIQYTVSGYALNNENTNIIIRDVKVFDVNTNTSTYTDINGFFTLSFDINSSLVIRAEKENYVFEDFTILSLIENTTHNFLADAYCADVIFTPPPGVYTQPITIEMTSYPADANIFYTIDGSNPTQSSLLYNQPIPLGMNSEISIKARAFRPFYNPSEIAVGDFSVTVSVPQPIISHPTGQYFEALNVTISVDDADAVIRYTLNGATPTVNSPIYSQPIFINKNTFLKAIAFKDDYIPSPESNALYEISHLIDFNLPSPERLEPNETKTWNLRDYITDSVVGEHIYHFRALSTPQNLTLSIDNDVLTITPVWDWEGTETIELEVRYEPQPILSAPPVSLRAGGEGGGSFLHSHFSFLIVPNIAQSTMVVEVYPDIHPPYIFNWYPDYPEEDDFGLASFEQYSTIEFFVNLTDQENISYEWFVNGTPRFHDNSLYGYTFSTLEPIVMRVEVSNLHFTVSRTWHVDVTVSEDIEIEPTYTDQLIGNFPNPFNPETTILFTLADDDFVDIAIYNIRGQIVEQLTNSFFTKGQNQIVWNAAQHSSGVYLVYFRTTNHFEIKRMVLIK